MPFGSSEYTGLGTNGFEVSLNYLSGVPDPNELIASNDIRLAFKGLQKRDATTRERSISELLTYVDSHTEDDLNDDLLIMAWVQMYAKLSLDDSKKVRTLSHQIQSQFVSSLGKRYLKYLRDTVGIWLAGLFDTDRSTAKICSVSITEAFGNNETRIKSLWKVFTIPILSYCQQLLTKETKDTLSDDRVMTKEDMENKWVRSALAAILLFTKAVSVLQDSDVTDGMRNIIYDILNCEKFTDLFTSTDLNVKKATYQLLKTLIVSKHVDTIFDEKLYASLAKAAIKGLKVDKNKPVILYSNAVLPILDTLVTMTKYNDTFWTSSKKASERLNKFVALGSLNSNPVYFDLVVKLFTVLPDEFVSWTDYGTAEHATQLLIANIEKEKSVRFLERAWTTFLLWICFLLTKLQDSDTLLDLVTLQIVKLLDSPTPLSTPLLNSLHLLTKITNDDKDVLLDVCSCIMQALPNGSIKMEEIDLDYHIENQDNFIINFVNVLFVCKSDLAEVLIANATDSLNDEVESFEEPNLSFKIIDTFIKKNAVQYKDTIESLVSSIDRYISKSFIESPLKLLVNYSVSSLVDITTLNSTLDAIYEKLDSCNEVDKLIEILPKLQNFNVHETSKLSSYLVSNSVRSQTPENETDVLYNFLTLEILQNLYISDPLQKFVTNIDKHYSAASVLEFVKTNDNFVVQLFNQLDSENYEPVSRLLDKIEAALASDLQLQAAYIGSIKSFLNVSNISPVWSRVSKLDKSVIKTIINQDLLSDLESQIAARPYENVLMANPLQSGLLLFGEPSSDTINADLGTKLLGYPVLLAELIRDNSDLISLDSLLQLGIYSEYASDLVFLSSNLTEALEAKLIDYQSITANELTQRFQSFSIADIINDNVLKKYLENTSLNISSYAHRIMKLILDEKLESSTLETFEALDIAKIQSTPIIYILTNSGKAFLTSKTLDKLRNTYLVNTIGLRTSSQIASEGLKNLVMLNSLLDLDLDHEISDTLTLIPAQRFMMFLNSIENWLDCDIAYEEEFYPLRLVMIEFVVLYIRKIYYVCDSQYPSDFIDKVFNLGVRLVTETLNIINSEKCILDTLTYSILKLSNLLNEFKDQVNSWDEARSDIEDELIELFFMYSSVETGFNQPLKLNCQLLTSVLDTIVSLQKLSSYYNTLFPLLDTKNVDIQRMVCMLLHKLIPKVQDDLVIEFTLSKKKINDDGVSDITLPANLLCNVKEGLNDHIEFEEHWKVYKLLWSWFLVMDHFKNITHQMRQDYINEVGNSTISSFLLSIFEEIDISKFANHGDTADYIKDYSLINNLEYSAEIEKLLINLLFDITNYVGGTFTQTWFQSIRDKQMKASVENIFKKYISPSLITDVLSSLSDKNKVEDDDFKIIINKKANEIKCLFEIDEQKMEISVSLPENFPLTPITVNGISRVGVDEKKWKSWIMSAQYVINFQNGTVLDAIKHFKANVKSNFENYEDCAICYSILNAVDHSTPNKKCTTCKNNFHSACLYRWFKSSGSSTCPLCRTKFQFKRHA